MSSTRAVPRYVLEAANPVSPGGLPLCPGCLRGYLQPFQVTIGLGPAGFGGAEVLEGWVAVCDGNTVYREHLRVVAQGDAEDVLSGVELVAGCGFVLPMTGSRRVP